MRPAARQAELSSQEGGSQGWAYEVVAGGVRLTLLHPSACEVHLS